jgi:hypothetical protein
MKYANGDTFSGEWLNDLKSGDRTYEFADGRVLSGSWRSDRAEGENTMRLPSRESYTGRWENGALVGNITYRRLDGKAYAYRAVDMQGFSFSRLKTAEGTYFGGLLDGLPRGLGSFANEAQMAEYVVLGSWDWPSIEGYAEKTLLTGEWYKGWWRANKLHGQGSYGWLDGTVYSGNWKGNKRSGYGVIKLPNGSKYEGEWQEDLLVKNYCYHNTHGEVKPGRGPLFYLEQVNEQIFSHKPRRDDTKERQSLPEGYGGRRGY